MQPLSKTEEVWAAINNVLAPNQPTSSTIDAPSTSHNTEPGSSSPSSPPKRTYHRRKTVDRERDRLRQRLKRANESPEERAKRLEQCRLRRREQRATESEAERTKRQVEDKLRHNLQRVRERELAQFLANAGGSFKPSALKRNPERSAKCEFPDALREGVDILETTESPASSSFEDQIVAADDANDLEDAKASVYTDAWWSPTHSVEDEKECPEEQPHGGEEEPADYSEDDTDAFWTDGEEDTCEQPPDSFPGHSAASDDAQEEDLDAQKRRSSSSCPKRRRRKKSDAETGDDDRTDSGSGTGSVLERRREADRVRQHRHRAAETPAERECRLAKERVRQQRRRATETPAQHAYRLQQVRRRQAEQRAAESAAAAERRREKERLRQRERRAGETPDQRLARLEQDRRRQQRRRHAGHQEQVQDEHRVQDQDVIRKDDF